MLKLYDLVDTMNEEEDEIQISCEDNSNSFSMPPNLVRVFLMNLNVKKTYTTNYGLAVIVEIKENNNHE